MSKLYTKCANCDEIVTETFDDESNCNIQSVLKQASVNHNCKQEPKTLSVSTSNITKDAAVEEQEQESAFITLHKLQFGEITK
jgi:hypothetical protein